MSPVPSFFRHFTLFRLFAGAGLLLSFPSLQAQQEEPPSPNSERSGIHGFEVQQASFGPWGMLEFSRIILEPSDFFVSISNDLKSSGNGTVWSIDAPDEETVAAILGNTGLPEGIIASLLASNPTRNEENGWFEIHPPDSVILGMTSSQREKLYPLLMPQEPENPFFQPFALPTTGIREVTGIETGLSEEALQTIEQLTYNKGRTKRFSDINFLFKSAENEEQRWRILKTLGRESSLSVRIVLSDRSNLSDLESYWSAGGRNRDVAPLLSSIAHTRGVDRLDIAHLLPPTPRKLIHTFPQPNGYGIAGDMPDCFWTAFSFFSDEPPERHLDFTNHVFLERYLPVMPPFQMGDLILLTDASNGDWLHACNYLAENLVFTKNGKSMGRAWSISKLQNVVETYMKVDEVKVAFYRLKPQYKQ